MNRLISNQTDLCICGANCQCELCECNSDSKLQKLAFVDNGSCTCVNCDCQNSIKNQSARYCCSKGFNDSVNTEKICFCN